MSFPEAAESSHFTLEKPCQENVDNPVTSCIFGFVGLESASESCLLFPKSLPVTCAETELTLISQVLALVAIVVVPHMANTGHTVAQTRLVRCMGWSLVWAHSGLQERMDWLR